MIEYYNNILCVEAGWLYGDGDVMTMNNYRNLHRRNHIDVVRRGCKGVTALVRYDTIPTRFKNIIVEVIGGDPYQYCKQSSFKDLVLFDTNADEYFRAFRKEDGTGLGEKTIHKYNTKASILNALHKLHNDNKLKRRSMGGTANKNFWKQAVTFIHELPLSLYPHDFGQNPVSLKRVYQKYMEEGLPSIIHKSFNNKNSEKINNDAQIWVIARWSNRVHKCATTEQLLREYNHEAIEKGWKELNHSKTLHAFLNREDIKQFWWGHRYGDAAAKEKYTFQHSTALPTMRDSLWYSDGTKMNYFYLSDEGKVETCMVYEVIDAYSEVLLGYHISKTENYEAQYHAYKMAANRSGHKPYQIGFDGQGGHKKLEAGDFFSKITKLAIKTAPYNGRSKTIESAFNRLQNQFLKQDWFFTGMNITAHSIESKANREMVLANKNELPTLNEVKKVYAKRREEWNNAPHPKTGEPRLQMYLNSKNPESPAITLEDMVDMFWMLRDKSVTLSMYGLTFQENKTKYTYIKYDNDRMPDIAWMRANVDKKFYVKFDPSDMDLIYVYQQGNSGLEFVTEMETKVQIHRGKQEQEEWEASYIDAIKQKNNLVRVQTHDYTEDVLEMHGQANSDYGFATPALLGINSKKTTKKTKNNSIGKVLKAETNVVQLDNNDEEPNYYDEY